jgi:Rrf2 family protein
VTPVTPCCDGDHAVWASFRTFCSGRRNRVAWPELPKRLHYALKSLCWLASQQGPVHADEIARCTGIPPAEAAKIMYHLAEGGFVSSRRGSRGGFWLRKRPTQVHVGHLLKFLYPFLPSSGGKDDCVLQVWKQTTASSQEAFAHYSLDDLLKGGHEYLGVQAPARR